MDQALQPLPSRIRRLTSLPRDMASEEAGMLALAYPGDIYLGRDNPYRGRYRIGPKSSPEGFDDIIVHRQVFCWLCFRWAPVGAMVFDEWFVGSFVTNREFIDALDTQSSAAYHLAEVVASVWRLQRLVDHGRIIAFSRLWVTPEHAKVGAWLQVANRLINRRYRRDAAVMLLKPFPLEYEGESRPGVTFDEAIQRRIRAMRRLYGHALGALPMPPASHEDTAKWMWRPLSKDTPPPRGRKPR